MENTFEKNRQKMIRARNLETLVIFGAPDHEEQLARKVAEGAGCATGTATCKGSPVHPGTAYKADGHRIDRPNINQNHQRVIIFECRTHAAQNLQGTGAYEILTCDHHNPGDPGFSMPAEEYWRGSSLGQLCMALNLSLQEAASLAGVDPVELEMTAAGDHCPADAYAGRCLSITPEEFGMFRRTQIWSFECERQGLDDSFRGKLEKYALVGEIYDHIQAAVRLLETGYKANGIVDLREYGLVPQLPEAALMTGKAYMSKIDETDRERKPTGNKKIVLGGHTTPRQVVAFMAWARGLANRIGEPYGNPTRGFAGVVVTERSCPTCKGAWPCETLGTCPECGVPYPPESQIG